MFEWLKGVVLKMLKKEDIESVINYPIAMDDDMYNAIEKWSNIYNGNAPWGSNTCEQLNAMAMLCNKVAKTAVIEFECSSENKVIEDLLEIIKKKAKIQTEFGLAKGSFIIKPFMKAGKVKYQFIQANSYYPISFDSDGNNTGMAFKTTKYVGDSIYTKFEIHTRGYVVDETEEARSFLKIEHLLYVSRKEGDLGSRVALTELPEYSDLRPETTIMDIDYNLFGMFNVPMANTIDNDNPMGVSLCSKAMGLLEQIDKQYSRILWEYEATEIAIDVDATAFTTLRDGKLKLPEGRERLYRPLNFDSQDKWEVFSPAIRDSSHFKALNELLMKLEDVVGVTRGTISYVASTDALTATEIKSKKQEYYTLVCDIQKSLEDCINETAQATIGLYQIMGIDVDPTFEIQYDWDDSVIVDFDDVKRQALIEKNAGLIDDIEYYKITRGWNEDEAIEFAEKLSLRKPKVEVENIGDGE